MSTDTTKIRSKLARLDESLDELESKLEPLFAKSLPETLLALDTIQQAKLQVIIPYVVYDLVFVYLKSRGIDPKTHPVVAELERVRQYFDKIKHAEDSDQKRKLGIDKAAADRFIKHAIAQAKNAQLVDGPSDAATVASSSSSHERVPVKVTSKMVTRAEYEKELKELGSEEDDDLQVFDEEMAAEDEEAMNIPDDPPEGTRSVGLDKGKGRASEEEQSNDEKVSSSRRKRPRVDPFSRYENLSVSQSTPQTTDHRKKVKVSTPVQSLSADTSSRGACLDIRRSRGGKSCKKGKA
ncbi:Sas10/Utp3/C1D family-domain-containing protein [Boletus coccyginus]|nr:Sas10/Utp3/C1D family-domain-containing protein [Boletus coccyginus]